MNNKQLSMIKVYCSSFIFLFAIFSALGGLQCNNKPTPPDDGNHYVPTIELTKVDVGLTDAWLRIKFLDTVVNRAFTLKRDGQTILTAQISSLDTVVMDDNLLANHLYNYKALRLVNNSVIDSAILAVPTLDTTSHNFTWEIDTLGDGNSSVLRDVCIINDTCVLAVGEIYKKDSTGQFETGAYNVAQWNGTDWQLLRIQVPLCGTNSTAPYQLYSVYAFSENDIWVSGGGDMEHWNGNSWRRDCSMNPLIQGAIMKIWGTSSTNLYGVGLNGTIIHYNGSSWQKIESGTDVNLTDIWGSPDGSVVWACGYYDDKVGTYLFKYNGIKWEIAYDGSESEFIIRNDSISGAISSIFTLDKRKIFIATTAGVYESLSNTNGKGKRISFTPSWFPGFPYRLRGNGYNDMFLSGNYYMLAHFNGSTMKYYENFSGYGELLSLYQKGSAVFAVGYAMDPIHSKGIVIRGRR
jgi:hypothetical protein